MTGYQINETDIEGAIRFLEVTDPDNATPEVAIELLEHLKASFHTLAHEDPKKLAEIYEELKKQKQLKTN